MIDLHMHTTASDGRDTPRELAARVQAAGITTFSVTDHDTIAGLDEAEDEARKLGLDFVPGIEVTAVYAGKDVHVLGYFLDRRSVPLAEFLSAQRSQRLERARRIGDRLAELGVPIDIDAIVRAAPSSGGKAIARPRLAQALVDAGHAVSIADAFDRFLSNDGPAYFPHTGGSPAEAVAAIKQAGGLASLAHPGVLRRDEIIGPLAAEGLAAIEAYHSDHDAETAARYVELARSLNLAITGGSDYHGEGTRRAAHFGSVGLPAGHFQQFCACR